MFRFFLGLFILIGGGEILIRYLAVIGDTLGVSRSFIGLVVVAFGTSLPEFFVSLIANLKGSPSVALGNVFGSFLANIGLVLGLSSLLRPLKVDASMVKKDIPMMILSLTLLFVLSVDGFIGRIDALFILAFFTLSLLNIRFTEEGESLGRVSGKSIFHFFMVFLGFFALIYGSDLLVQGAREISRRWKIAELIIGSTMVAIGTSIPELAATLIASRKGEVEIAVGNVVGSNIFNLLFIIGVVSLVRPLPVDRRFIDLFFPFMMGFSVVLFLKARSSGILGRIFGFIFLAAYLFFVYVL